MDPFEEEKYLSVQYSLISTVQKYTSVQYSLIYSQR